MTHDMTKSTYDGSSPHAQCHTLANALLEGMVKGKLESSGCGAPRIERTPLIRPFVVLHPLRVSSG